GSRERYSTSAAVVASILDGSIGMGLPTIDCAKCDQNAVIRRMAVTYETSFDVEARESVHRRVGVKYDAECPNCGYSFSLTVDDAPADTLSKTEQKARLDRAKAALDRAHG